MRRKVYVRVPAWIAIITVGICAAAAVSSVSMALKVADVEAIAKEALKVQARTAILSDVSQITDGTDGKTDAPEEENAEIIKDIDAEENEAETDDFTACDWIQTSLGEVTITHYCHCEKCCGAYSNGITASGAICTEGTTVACDFLPFGTTVNINGHLYTVQDRIGEGSTDHIDIYVTDHSRALELGTYRTEVYAVAFGGDDE